jgi:ribosomal protein S25
MQLFGKYPYLISYISINELSQRMNISSEALEKFLRELQRKALEEMERQEAEKRKRWMEEIFKEEVFIY